MLGRHSNVTTAVLIRSFEMAVLYISNVFLYSSSLISIQIYDWQSDRHTHKVHLTGSSHHRPTLSYSVSQRLAIVDGLIRLRLCTLNF